MRIHLTLTKPSQLIPFDYHSKLVGTFHKWLGKNEIHNDVSLYSFSSLLDGENLKNGIKFNTEVKWFISAYDNNVIKKLIQGIQEDLTACYDMKVKEITIQENPDFTDKEYFKYASPIFLKRRIENEIKFYTFSDIESDKLLTETLKTKMKRAGLREEQFSISFNRNYNNAKTTFVKYNGMKNLVNLCPIVISGSNTVKQFAWNVGIGNSTGIGLGAIH